MKSLWQLHFRSNRLQDGLVLPFTGGFLRLWRVFSGILSAGGGWVFSFCVGIRSNWVYRSCDPLRYANLRLDLTLPRSLTGMLWWENIRTFSIKQVNFAYLQAFKHVCKDANIAVFGALSIAVRTDSSSLQDATSIHNFISVPIRSAGLLSKCGDNCRFPQSERAKDPQQFPGVQFSNGWYGHLHERHRRRVLQLPEVSDVTTRFHKAQTPVWSYERQHSA